MKNRTKHLIAYIILTVMPLLLVGISLFLLPDKIPTHYSIDGTVDRYGSKFELLIFPVLSIVFGAAIFICSKFSSRKETSTKNNEKIVLVMGECTLSLFLALNIYFLYTAFYNVTDMYALKLDAGSVLCFLMGLLFIVIGNLMPKAKRNFVVGLRLPWVMNDDELWKKSQHFGGIVCIICGFLLLISAFIFRGFVAMIAFLPITAIMVIVCTVYSYVISHKKETKE